MQSYYLLCDTISPQQEVVFNGVLYLKYKSHINHLPNLSLKVRNSLLEEESLYSSHLELNPKFVYSQPNQD